MVGEKANCAHDIHVSDPMATSKRRNNEKLSYINERNALLKQAQEIQQSTRAITITGQFRDVFTCSYATLTSYTNERLPDGLQWQY